MSHAMIDAGIAKGARVCLVDCLRVKADETCLVLTDEELVELARHFLNAGIESGIRTLLIDVGYLERHGSEPPRAAADLLKAVDCALLITGKSLTHTEARADATQAGVRIASMPLLTSDIVRGPLVADYSVIERTSQYLAGLLTRSSTATLRTPRGTELVFDLTGRTGVADTGVLDQPGAFGNLPAGEAAIAPLEGLVSGTLVVDGAIAGVGVPSDSVVLKIEAGVIVEFSGGSQADELRALLDKADEKAACVAELGIGTNPKAVLSGHPLVDEKVLGTVHIGFGSNAHMGGCQTSNSHLDAVVLEPSLTLDGEMILKAGQPLWPTSWARG